jgi:arylformamidase
VIYIHGGYWQTLNKEDFAFVGQGPLELGYNVVLAEYTPAPQSSMTQMVQEIGRLLDHLASNRDELKIGHGPVCLVGHSAGGHLGLVLLNPCTTNGNYSQRLNSDFNRLPGPHL